MTLSGIIKKILRDLELSEAEIEEMYANVMVKAPIQDYQVPEEHLVEMENQIRVFMAEHLIIAAQDPEEFDRRGALYAERLRKSSELN